MGVLCELLVECNTSLVLATVTTAANAAAAAALFCYTFDLNKQCVHSRWRAARPLNPLAIHSVSIL